MPDEICYQNATKAIRATNTFYYMCRSLAQLQRIERREKNGSEKKTHAIERIGALLCAYVVLFSCLAVLTAHSDTVIWDHFKS